MSHFERAVMFVNCLTKTEIIDGFERSFFLAHEEAKNHSHLLCAPTYGEKRRTIEKSDSSKKMIIQSIG